MAKQFQTPIDLAKNELQNAVVQPLGSDPSSPVEGQIYYHTTDKKLKQYNGTTWIEYGTGAGSGDVTSNTSSSVDGEVALFSSTTGKVVKRATGTGLAKLTSGVLSTATSGTDYAPATSGSSALKGNGSGGFSNATLNDVGSATADYSLNSHKLTSVTDPTSAQDAATKNYVDNAVSGLSWKTAVRVATTATGTLASAFANGSTVDGVTLATGDRILIKDQSTGSENGIYVVAASGAPTRATDADSGAELVNATVYVSEGTANADTVWTCTNNATITPGTTALVFAQVNGGTVPTATSSTAGKVQLATQAEAEAKSNTAKAVVPADLANFPIKKTATIGDGSSTSIAVTHSLGTKDVVAQVRDASTDAVVECDITQTSTTVTTFGFAVAPASNAYKVVIVG
jgi:hypothetical protein